jgi:DNA-binding CsgD family transcriptional regulator
MIKPIDINYLKKLYYKENLPIKEIEKELKIKEGSLYYVLRINNLPSRERPKNPMQESITKEVLFDLYINQNKTMQKIAKETGLSTTCIFKLIKLFNIPKRRVHIDKETLLQKYIIEHKTIKEIAAELNVGQGRISYDLHQFGILTKFNNPNIDKITKETLSDKVAKENKTICQISKEFMVSQTVIFKQMNKYGLYTSRAYRLNPQKLNFETLNHKYTEEEKTTYEIAREMGVHRETVSKYLKEYNIPIREYVPTPIEETFNITKEILYQKYWVELKTTYEIADEYNISATTIFKLLKKYDIGTRSASDLKGPLSSGWKGGISFLPYCPEFNDNLKEKIRTEFGRVCYLCGKTEVDEGKGLCVHHIDYNKKQGCGHKWALIPLCNSCHLRTNGNRWYYFNLFINYWILQDNICLNLPGINPGFNSPPLKVKKK